MTQTGTLPRIVITGASGFIGRHLLELLKPYYRIYAMGRRSAEECGAPRHPNIHWDQVDIGDCEPLTALFHRLGETGGADVLIHLAAHYDFTGDDHPEYWRTNVEGLRNVLELSRGLNLKRFVFASSSAACSFPPPGGAITEATAPDGEHIYSVTKRIGEEMVNEFRADFPATIVRFAALFSDWCEYPPLFVFLETWLSSRWNARMLGGRGESAIPYMHVRDSSLFLRTLLEKLDGPHGEVLLASTDGAVTHRQLYDAATSYFFGRRRRPILMPKPLCYPGMLGLDIVGRLLGARPFERPWMAKYIDEQLTIDASWTRQRLSWEPRPRLEILRRVPFMLENYKTDPIEWNRRNREAMKAVHMRSNLRIHRLLEVHEGEISDTLTTFLLSSEAQRKLRRYQSVSREDHEWNHRLVLRNLMNSIRTREKGVFMAYSRDLAERRFKQGFTVDELSFVMSTLEEICLKIVRADPDSKGLDAALHDYISMTIQFGIDQIEETYEYLGPQHIAQPPTSRVEDQLWTYRRRRRSVPPVEE